MKVRGQLHAKTVFTALPLPREEASYLLNRDWMVLRAEWTFHRKEKSFVLAGIRTRDLQQVT